MYSLTFLYYTVISIHMQTSINIRASALTAHVLGLKKIITNATTSQAYLMLGNKCDNNCFFCSQAQSAESNQKFLSRISWPQFQLDELINSLISNIKDKPGRLKKICVQVVTYKNSFDDFIFVLKTLRKSLNLPISASIFVHSIEEMDLLFHNGLDRLGMAIDSVNAEFFKAIKETGLKRKISFHELKQLILAGLNKYPGKLAVHIIVGLGESDSDILFFMNELYERNAIVALFAFTPLPGTKMSSSTKVSLERYRKIQAAQHLLYKKIPLERFRFDSAGNLIKIDDFEKLWHDYLKNGEFMKTSGCPMCTRPYYNDSPKDHDLFNYFDQVPAKAINKWHEKLNAMIGK